MYGKYPIVFATYPRPMIPLPIATFFFHDQLQVLNLLDAKRLIWDNLMEDTGVLK